MNKNKMGYKVTKPDMTCRGYQYELGKVYKHEGNISLCNEGFHFCLQIQHCFNYYDFDPKNKVFEIKYGNIITEDDQSVTNTIEFVREVEWSEVLFLVNMGEGNTGHSNTGNWNTGDRNTGNRNTGNRNTGYRNSGYRNSGDWNTGYRNSGDSNSGDSNTGNRNTGYSNSGDWNTGDRNTGDWNTGNWNTGNWNTGDSNSGYRNSGAFCTDSNPVVWLFDQPTAIKVRDWEDSDAYKIMYNLNPNIWIYSSDMTDAQKEAYPEHETTGGFLKSLTMKDAWSDLWVNLTDDKKEIFTNLPNFDADKFEQITGINTLKISD